LAYWLEGAPARSNARQSQRLQVRRPDLLDSTRARLRLALLVSIATVAVLGFVIFPARRQSITADGTGVTVVSRQQDIGAVLGFAGVRQQQGDVLLRTGRDVVVERAVPVVVDVDGQALAWRTRAGTIESLFDEMAVAVGPYDTVFANGVEVSVKDAVVSTPAGAVNPALPDSVSLSVTRAVPMTIVEDGRTLSFHSARPTLGLVLRDAGIVLGPADEVYPAPGAAVIPGMRVEVRHAKAITLRLGESTSVIYTQKESLREALAETGLTFGPDDRVEPSIEAAVSNGMTARVVRVAGRSFVEREPVVRKTVFKPDEELAGSAYRFVQGHDGVHLREYKVVIEDGVEREKSLVKEWNEPEVVDNVIYYAASSVRATGLAPENLRAVATNRMYATWYNAASSGRSATDPWYGFTASGVPVTRGIVATDPRVIPLGSRLYVPGYGFAVAGDTGGGIVGNMIDLGYPDGAPVDWHTGWVEVFILAP
jgi:uncharacterized protein YabE (DUF348 family)/3D (Asp-Asp-Asp) domain-containing protein